MKIFNGLKISLIVVSLLIMSNFFTSCKMHKTMIDNSVVNDLDIQRYLGKWYEIARYDHRFERGMVGVTANYSMQKNGKIKVINSGYKGSLDGTYSEAVGKAKIPDAVNNPAKLKVSFFLFFYGDYYVMELDKDYEWAVIGSSSDSYLWILSRQPQMGEELYSELLERLKKRGYDVSILNKVEQKASKPYLHSVE